MAVDWNYFNRYDEVISRHMPARGEGEIVADQIVTAVNKLIYKWYSDGDVYDNTHCLTGWANDLSSYANWLSGHAKGTEDILKKITDARIDDDYEDIIRELADLCLNEEYLRQYNAPKIGSIYDCEGSYKFIFDEDDEDDEYY